MPGKSYTVNPLMLLRITGIFWLIAKLISYKAWLPYRLFPVIPVFDALSNISVYIHLGLFVISIICLGILIFLPGKKVVSYILLFAEISSLLLDYTRWQPWEYQYLFILLIFLLNRNEKSIITALSFLFAALYFYSGLQKLNSGFLQQIWNSMLLSSFLKIPHSIRSNDIVIYSGYFIGIIEAIAGLCLLFRRTQKQAAVGLILIHIFNLIWLGPLGINYNLIVWPWNVMMIIGLYLIYIRNAAVSVRLRLLLKPQNLPVVLFWGLLPALNFAGYWDAYLSCSLYSGKLPLMAVCINSPDVQKQLQQYVRKKDVHNFCEGKPLIKLQSWAIEELNVPPYPELRVYCKIERILTQKYPGSSAYLYYYGSPLKFNLLQVDN